MNIGYKVVAAICAFAVILVAVFVPIISIRLDSIAASLLVTIGEAIGNEKAEEILKNNNGNYVTTIGEEIAIIDLLSPEASSVAGVISSLGDNKESSAMEQLETLRGAAVTFVVIFILVIVCAIATVFVAIFAKDNRKVIYCALSGVGLSYMLITAFKAVAAPFLDGTITLATLADSVWVSLLGEIKNIEISTGAYVMLALFAAIILWTVLYNFTLPEKAKQERKIMLGEAD